MKILVNGKILDKKITTSKNGQTNYFYLYIYCGGKNISTVRVDGNVFSDYESGDDVSLECDYFVNYEKKYMSLYVKSNN